jgi:hypothetical protein
MRDFVIAVLAVATFSACALLAPAETPEKPECSQAALDAYLRGCARRVELAPTEDEKIYIRTECHEHVEEWRVCK